MYEHLCGVSDCPGEELHRHPRFWRSAIAGHPDSVKSAELHTSSMGSNLVLVKFADGAAAVFPGDWLRREAQKGDNTVKALYSERKWNWPGGWKRG